MNKEWAEQCKNAQTKIKKRDSFEEGIDNLLILRNELMKQIFDFKKKLNKEEFCAIPFINSEGYHNKTIAYSLYHIFRIEDIVANSLIKKDNEIYFKNNYKEKMNSPIITTGNELEKENVSEFSKKLEIDELYNYIVEVDNTTTELLKGLNFDHTKIKMTEKDKEELHKLKVVSEDEGAVWLIDYWCNKNIQGLINMPFSRHWIMHLEACLRIEKKIKSI